MILILGLQRVPPVQEFFIGIAFQIRDKIVRVFGNAMAVTGTHFKIIFIRHLKAPL